MTFKTILASVSAVALLAGPVAAQTANPVDPAGARPETQMKSDADTTINNETAVDAGENMRTGVPAEQDTASSAMDSPYTIGTTNSLQMELNSDMMVADSPWVGKTVTTADGIPVGSVTEVYTDGTTDTARVMLDDSLGLDADEFLIQMGSGSTAGDLTLAQNEVEFKNEMAEIVGTEMGATENSGG